LQKVLDKISWYKVCIVQNVLDGETGSLAGLPEIIKTKDIVIFNYAPINSVDVEWLFTIYKNKLSNCQRSLKFENISKIIVIQCDLIFSYLISIAITSIFKYSFKSV